MKKIPNLFERDWQGDKSRVLPELHREADVGWVLRGEGVPTVKWDGSAVMVKDNALYVRYDAKKGKFPEKFLPCQDPDPKTGHWPGWIPADGNPTAKWHRDAYDKSFELYDGTYEACGPQLQSNPYKFPHNILIRHGDDPLVLPGFGIADSAGAAFDYLKTFLATSLFKHRDMPEAMTMEGIVWHHPDGRMVKVLASDLGIDWKKKVRGN